MRQELQAILVASQTLPPEQLPRLLGDLEEVRATVLARLIAPTTTAQGVPDKLLAVDEAAHCLGVSPDYLYHNHRRLPFTRRMGRNLRFSAQGIEKYLQRGKVHSAKRPASTKDLAQ